MIFVICLVQFWWDINVPGGPSVKRSLVSRLEKYLEEDPLSVTTRTPSLKTCRASEASHSSSSGETESQWM